MQTSLNRTFHALAHPSRRWMLERLNQGPLRVRDLAEPLEITQQAVSKHVDVLKRARLVKQRKVGRERWCELSVDPLRDAVEWMRQHQWLWDKRLDSLERLFEDEA